MRTPYAGPAGIATPPRSAPTRHTGYARKVTMAPPPDTTVEYREGTFTGAGDATLFYRRWAPTERPGGVIVIAHGLGEHSGRYDYVARRFAGHGYATWALDHRGHGQSEGDRVFVDRFTTYETDLETFRQLATGTDAGLRAVLLGHSMGGAIAVGHVIDHPDRFDALVLTGPVLDPGRGVAKPMVVIGKLASKLLPKAGLIALDATKVSRDPAVVADYQNDPLVHHGKITARLGAELLDRAARFPRELGRVRLPVLVIHGTDDTLVPVHSSRDAVPMFGSEDVTYREETGLYHEVLNEPERDRIIDGIVEWIDARLANVGRRP